MSIEELAGMAHRLVEELRQDVSKCKTREEHIRVTARANEADHLLHGLLQLTDGEISSPEQGPLSATRPGPVA